MYWEYNGPSHPVLASALVNDAGHGDRNTGVSLATPYPAQQPTATEMLKRLLRAGFGGRRLYGQHGELCTLHYRRQWRRVSDVVLVYAADDAEAYRVTSDVISLEDPDPFAYAERVDLEEEVVGTVTDVVTAVLNWPTPESWLPHFPPARS